jgi:hypothetical protein
MDKPKIPFILSILLHAGRYPGLTARERKSLLQRLSKRDRSDRSGKAEEDIEMGYESSWSGIFTSTRG